MRSYNVFFNLKMNVFSDKFFKDQVNAMLNIKVL